MDTIGSQKIWSFVNQTDTDASSNTAVRKSGGVYVESYLDLARKVSTIQYLNRDFVLMFRGQSGDWKNRSGNSSLKPGLTRSSAGVRPDYEQKFATLLRAEELLVDLYAAAGLSGTTRLSRQRILRWAILQHYEVCDTPLLDVTHSLRIAASFASLKGEEEAFVFALGVPNLSGAITASAEAGLQVIRLSSVCPPEAVRPHIQEGYLLGEYPDMDSVKQKGLYPSHEIDFGLRMVAKFRFRPSTFWQNSEDFPLVPKAALYPASADDPLRRIADDLRSTLKNEVENVSS